MINDKFATMNKPVVAISLLSEMAQAISHLTPDRALLFLTESAVSVTESDGAILLTPHEKNSLMIPFVRSYQKRFEEPTLSESLLKKCYSIFTGISEANGKINSSNLKEVADFEDMSFWPVMLSGKPVALLVIYKKLTHADFSDEHKSFLEIITPFMGSLLENFRLNNEMIHKNSRLSALYEISQQAESLIDLRDIYDSLGKVAKSFINFDAYLLYLLSSDGQTLDLKLAEGEAESFPRKILKGEGPVGLAARQLRPYLTYTKDFNSVLILPVEVSDQLMGVLVVASKKAYAYRDEDIIGLRIIATQIASIEHMFKDLISIKGFTERILESMTSGVLFFDANGHVTYSNSEITRIFARPFPVDWSIDNTDEPLPEEIDKLLKEVLLSNLTVENKRVKISERHPYLIVEVNAFPFRNEQGSMMGTAFFIKDVTNICSMEEQLKRAEKLSALGVLAAGIAHEIRNPLTGMKMIVQLLDSDFNKEDFRREPLNIIQNEINRLERIIGNLLDFAKPSKPRIVKVAIESVLDDCLMLVKNQLKKQGIKLRKNFSKSCSKILADPDQLKQVFINILTNAIQALGAGGELSVSVEPSVDAINVKIEDNGSGIAPQHLNDIFNPFMTTKEDGTGLGLSMVQRILEEHGGRIEVNSVLDEGSIFVVRLPLKKI